MIRYRIFTLLSLCLGSACGLSIDATLEGKRCDDRGACLPGYVCSPFGICERPSTQPLLPDAATADAGLPPETSSAAPPDAHVELDASSAAAAPDASSPATVAPDSSVADAGQPDAAAVRDAATSEDAQAPDASQPPADAAVSDPPPTVGPRTMSMPVAPPVPGGGTQVPPVPGVTPPKMDGDCQLPRVRCLAECVSLRSDDEHCGACDNACGRGESCEEGACKKAKP
jgi:hypothetical protein